MEELLEKIVLEALKLEVTDLHFKSMSDSTIYMRLKNQILPFKTMSLEKYRRLLTYLQYRAQLDFNRLSSPQTGSFQLTISQKVFYFRLSYLPSTQDVHLVLRFLNHFNSVKFTQLSNDRKTLNEFENLLKKESGLIVVCGPTGSGKSTTLHCFLEELNRNCKKNIVTIEDPIEIYIPGIIQIQVNESIGLTFDAILDQILRHDPDIIMIGELRNEYSAKIALKLSLTGHLVLTTLHASDGKTAIKRLLNFNLDEDELSQVLQAIISQRLFYHPITNLPIVIFEKVYRKDILNLFNELDTSYIPLTTEIEKFYERGDLSNEDFQRFC